MVVGWRLLAWPRLRIVLMTLISCYFYACNNAWLILLLLFTTLIDFLVARFMERTEDRARRRRLLLVSLISNLGLLAFFKYSNFLVGSAVDVSRFLGFDIGWTKWDIALPIGI